MLPESPAFSQGFSVASTLDHCSPTGPDNASSRHIVTLYIQEELDSYSELPPVSPEDLKNLKILLKLKLLCKLLGLSCFNT